MVSYKFAYYVSGHGFGHATRVVALTHVLLKRGHLVYIVTDAQESIFYAVIKEGALYRKAPIDAGITQPQAYSVDRKKTLTGLQSFLHVRAERITTESTWLREMQIDAVLVDAPFLPCAAAAQAGIPSAIISNFTFDSCYSYLDAPVPIDDESEDEPLDPSILEPLVQQAIADYANATLLLRLPGAIPLPAFDDDVPLPSSRWVDRKKKAFTKEVQAILDRSPDSIPSCQGIGKRKRVIDTPLITRHPSKAASSLSSRRNLLTELGVPDRLQEVPILLVSFGGQNIPRPRSRANSPSGSPNTPHRPLPPTHMKSGDLLSLPPPSVEMQRVASEHHLYLPGAPRADTHTSTHVNGSLQQTDRLLVPKEGLLPDGWIALVCGLSNKGTQEELPERFYACPSDIYVPDVCAISNVLLGKLGYGTCSETITAQLPFVFVPRPLFVEEYGLKRLMEQRNTIVEMDRSSFEQGYWAQFVQEAYEKHQARNIKPVVEEDAGTFIAREVENWMLHM